MKNIFKKSGNLSSISTIISLSLVLFVIGILALVLINTKQISNTIKEEGIVFSMMLYDDNPDFDSYDAKVKAEYVNTNGIKEIENLIEGFEKKDVVVDIEIVENMSLIRCFLKEDTNSTYKELHRKKFENYLKRSDYFLKDDIKFIDKDDEIALQTTQRNEFINFLKGKRYFLDIKFIDKEIAYKKLQEDMGEDLSSILGVNPLPDSYDANVKAKFVSSDGLKKIVKELEDYKGGDVVKDVFYQEKMVEKIDSKTSEISLFLLPFCVVFLLISFALINNTIRLSIYSKRLSIRTMRLVGATNMFIQKPYLISSIYQGFFSSVIAIFMLIGSIEMLKEIFPEFFQPNDFIEIAIIFGLILIFGIIISWISTFFAVRRYLNLNENELFN